jgi:hypothetical protein
MGRYATFSSDVTDRYPRVMTDSRAASLLDATYVVPAEAELDSRLAPSFTTPFSSNNWTVKDIVIDMTLIKMGMFKDGVQRKELLDSIDKRINGLLDGTIFMVDSGGNTLLSASSGVINTTADYHPVFGMGGIEDMRVDETRVEDEEDARS